MIRWSIDKHMARKGWTTPYRLAAETGISQPAAARVLAGDWLDRIDVHTLETLAVAFRVKPWALLEYVPEEG